MINEFYVYRLNRIVSILNETLFIGPGTHSRSFQYKLKVQLQIVIDFCIHYRQNEINELVQEISTLKSARPQLLSLRAEHLYRIL